MSDTLDHVRQVPGAPSFGTRLRRTLLGRDAAIIALVVIVYLIGVAGVPHFGTALTVYNLLLDILPILLIALPMTLVIIGSEIDLSVASMMGLASALVGLLYQAGWPVGLACVVALVVGALGGALNGLLITVVGLPSLAVTVGTLALFRGVAQGTLGDASITDFPEQWGDLVKNRLFGQGTALPGIVLLFVVLAIIAIVLLHYTPIGRALYSVGLNDEASRFSGIRVPLLKFWLFVATGTVSALAGIIFTFNYDVARGDNATGLELSVVAAVLVGGVSIFGGRGALPGVIAGVLLIGVLRSALRLADVPDQSINVAVGLLLVVSVIFPRVVEGVRALVARSRRRASAPVDA